jgi:hypothetical protein
VTKLLKLAGYYIPLSQLYDANHVPMVAFWYATCHTPYASYSKREPSDTIWTSENRNIYNLIYVIK